MSKLVENIVKSVYKVLFGVEDYAGYNIIPRVVITSNTFEVITPPTKTFPREHRHELLEKSTRGVTYIISDLKSEFNNRVLLGSKGYYRIPDVDKGVDRISYGRIIESNDDYYQVVKIPFFKFDNYSSYLDDLPTELLYIILLKSKLKYKQSRDLFSRVFDTSYFTWKKLFADTFPKAYSDVVNNPILISNINSQDEWRKLYEFGIEQTRDDFGVGISKSDNASIVLMWNDGYKYTGLTTYKTVNIGGQSYVL